MVCVSKVRCIFAQINSQIKASLQWFCALNKPNVMIGGINRDSAGRKEVLLQPASWSVWSLESQHLEI